MKRTALLLLTAIYLLSCAGIGINRFYCCGRLASVTLTYPAADNPVKDAGKKNNCCRNEKQSFKVSDSHFSAATPSLNHPVPAIASSFIGLNNRAIVNPLQTKIVYKGNAPPGHGDIPVYTFCCNYRI